MFFIFYLLLDFDKAVKLIEGKLASNIEYNTSIFSSSNGAVIPESYNK
jgi:hypothetical protein